MSDHKHSYETVRNVPAWWRRMLGAPTTTEYRCRICLLTIEEVIEVLKEEYEVAADRFIAAVGKLRRVPVPFDHGDGEICEDDHA